MEKIAIILKDQTATNFMTVCIAEYCELQSKCQLVSEFSIENAERMENRP